MTPLDQWSAVHACEQLVYLAAQYTDQRAWDELAAMFVPEGVLVRPSDRSNPILGREQILRSLKSRPARITRHIVSNVRVQMGPNGTAHISSMVVLYAGTATLGDLPFRGDKVSVGHFEDDVMLTTVGWAFVHREGSMALEYSCK